MQGESMVPMLKNTKIKGRNALYYHYYEYPEPHRVAPHFGIRTEKYKLIRFYGPHDEWELFDITKDPREMKNIYSSSSSKEIIIKLKKELLQLAQQYKDSLAVELINK
jgi:arylsulfatase A-like enzyme